MATAFLYFQLARRFDIVDVPNHRTLHIKPVIRGGGIIFPLGIVFYTFLFSRGEYPCFLAGLVLVAIVSFVDDLGHLSPAIRVPCQLIGISLLVWQVGFFEVSWFLSLGIVIVGVGTLNAYNFMDGINGITGGYSTLCLLSLIYINSFVEPFTSNELLFSVLLGLVVFNFLNFRKKALCFAGDVGSVSIAFIIIFLILLLIRASAHPSYILLLTVYGIDTIFTILQRLLKRENIFEAHRQHLYQLIVSQKGVSHLRMSFVYISVQLVINFIVIQSTFLPVVYQYLVALIMLAIVTVLYFSLKRKLKG